MRTIRLTKAEITNQDLVEFNHGYIREQGTDLRYIQELLGHACSKTTERYTHVSQNTFNKFKNPIDDLDI
jgi:site-specific recombinase XerC